MTRYVRRTGRIRQRSVYEGWTARLSSGGAEAEAKAKANGRWPGLDKEVAGFSNSVAVGSRLAVGSEATPTLSSTAQARGQPFVRRQPPPVPPRPQPAAQQPTKPQNDARGWPRRRGRHGARTGLWRGERGDGGDEGLGVAVAALT